MFSRGRTEYVLLEETYNNHLVKSKRSPGAFLNHDPKCQVFVPLRLVA